MKEVEEKLVKAREESAYYTEYETQDNKKYYFNTKTSQSTWEKPKCLVELAGMFNSLTLLELNHANSHVLFRIRN